MNISAKQNSNTSNEIAENVNFNFSQYTSMGNISCHNNKSSYPTGTVKKTHNYLVPPPIDAKGVI